MEAPPPIRTAECRGAAQEKVILLAPFGTSRSIHPWGIFFLKDALMQRREDVRVDVWHMHRDEAFQDILSRHSDVVEALRPWIVRFSTRLGTGSADPWRNDLSRWESRAGYFSAVSLAAGPTLYQSIRKAHPIRGALLERRARGRLSEFRAEVETSIRNRLQSMLQGRTEALVGISTYGGTLLSSLYVGRLLKSWMPELCLILGGEAIDPAVARELSSRLSWLDGAVAGHGEDVLLSILDARSRGLPLQEITMPGWFPGAACGRAPPGDQYSIIRAYEAHSPQPVHIGDDGVLHVFSRRGCGWGRCAFCREWERKLRLDSDLERVCARARGLLDEARRRPAAGPRLRVRIGSDNNDLDWLAGFLDFLEGEGERADLHFDVWFHLTARLLVGDRFHLVFRPRRHVTLSPAVGIETLNPKTLRDMRKGVDILTVLMSLKLVQDLGGRSHCNYFAFFPLEDSDSVAQEVQVLQRSLHLLVPSRAAAWLITYTSSNLDEVYANQERFGVVVRVHNDVWLSRLFGVDLPICAAAGTSYSLTRSENLDFPLVRTWHHAVYDHVGSFLGAVGDLKRSRSRARQMGLLARLAARSLLLLLSLAKLVALALWLGDLAYVRRAYLYLRYLQFPFRTWGREPVLKLDDGTVTRARFPGGPSGSWVAALPPLELSLLRYLYAPHTHEDVLAAFAKDHERQEVDDVLSGLISRGMVLRWKHRLLSLVHDPEGLRAALAGVVP